MTGEAPPGKYLRWMVGGMVILVLLIVVSWEFIGVRLVPKWVLRNALSTAIEQLDHRFANHPVRILTEKIDFSDPLQMDFRFSAEKNNVDSVNGNLLLKLDISQKRWYGEGSVGSGQNNEDMMLYLDPSEVVVGRGRSSVTTAYGIRYDCFSEDIRRIPYLAMLVGEGVFDAWEEKLLQVKDAADADIYVPQLPEVTDEMVQSVLLGILVLPCTVESVPCSSGERNCCYKIDYHIAPETLRNVLSGLNTAWDISFVLHNNRLVQIDAAAEDGTSAERYRVACSTDIASGPLKIQVFRKQNGMSRAFSVCVVTKAGQNHISETWEIGMDFDGTVRKNGFSYTWHPETGEMNVYIPSKEPLSIRFLPQENGISLFSKDWSQILDLSGIEWGKKLKDQMIHGTLAVRNGGAVTVPQCKYLDQWSVEELLRLLADLKAIGSFQ